MYIFTYITLHACLCAVFDDPEDDYGLQDSGGMPLDASADPQAHLTGSSGPAATSGNDFPDAPYKTCAR